MKEHNLKGTIRYYGCPAEENAGGKAFLVRDGYFNDCDLALCWHREQETAVQEAPERPETAMRRQKHRRVHRHQ